MTAKPPVAGGSQINPTLMDLIRVCYQWRKLILFLTLGLTFSTAVIMVFTPNSYTATGTILLELNESSFNLDLLGNLGSLAGLRTGATSEQIYMAILKSRLLEQAVIDSLDLSTHYKIEGATSGAIMEVTRHTLNRNIRFKCPDGVALSISAKDTDPTMAARISNVFIHRLIQANQTLTVSRTHRTREMIEEALVTTEHELGAARDRLRRFQSEFGIFALDEQTMSTLKLISDLQGQLLSAQTRRKALAGVKREGAADLRSLDLTIEALQDQIDRLVGNVSGTSLATPPAATDPSQETPAGRGDNPGFLLPLGSVPDLSGAYARIMMDLKILESKYTVLTSQLETTKIDESQSAPSFEVLDWAKPPFLKSGPNRTLYVAVALLSSLLAGILLAILITDISQRFDTKTQTELISMLPAPVTRLLRLDVSNRRRQSSHDR